MLTFEVEQYDGKWFAHTALGPGRDRYYLWRDGSLRRCVTTRYKADKKVDGYFDTPERAKDNVVSWQLGHLVGEAAPA